MKEPKFKEKFIGMPIKMFAYEHDELFITKKDENAFILYYILNVMACNLYTWGEVETSISLLSKKLPIKNKESDNRAEIKRLLLSLSNKGFIRLFYDDEQLNYDTLLTVRMLSLDDPHIMDMVTSDNYKHVGWVRVTEEMFRACKGDARHFRVLIYMEWRMFRGQDNEGTYCISYGEWEKVLDISHPTAVNLIKEMVDLNLMYKDGGKFYTDEYGNCKQETNKYAPSNENQREEAKAKVKIEDTDSLEKKQNRTVLALVNQMDVTDSRTKKTNLFNSSKKVYLTPYCYYVWKTTSCKQTKAQGDKRLEAIKKANPNQFNKFISQCEQEFKKYEREESLEKASKSNANLISNSNIRDQWWDEEDAKKYQGFSEKRRIEREKADALAELLDA
ncbi:hypothetical protein [Paenibacillus odorifer]|uniref:hypothetical protein n=1 Tax=Paenibacillus odorifer TaxID=189426 RepID=UPI0020C0DBB8|nr:hypothetical protein [Paenibacillus odorifer]